MHLIRMDVAAGSASWAALANSTTVRAPGRPWQAPRWSRTTAIEAVASVMAGALIASIVAIGGEVIARTAPGPPVTGFLIPALGEESDRPAPAPSSVGVPKPQLILDNVLEIDPRDSVVANGLVTPWMEQEAGLDLSPLSYPGNRP
ncbi:MAG: hypothetical protein IT305_16420 [Chloroflexi bacterium]|nr:hypothetical protein [Chloroflexota bacterium]